MMQPLQFCLLGTLFFGMFGAMLPAAQAAEKPGQIEVYVGTYTGAKSKGIYRFTLNLADGSAGPVTLAAETAGPSFLAFAPSGRFLYAVNEISEFKGKPAGGLSAFAVDPKTGGLTFLNQESTVGTGPCHLVVDATGKNVLVANYGGGSVASLPIMADGKLGEATSFIQHKGASATARQSAPHGHSINLDAANKFAVAADLGLDKLLVYEFDAEHGKLTPNDPPSTSTAAGAGPRHFTFHPNGKFAYVINELNSTVNAFAYDAEKGILTTIQTISSLPADFDGKSYTAEVQVTPNGKFLYGSNRGHDSLAAFKIDAKTGKLTPAGIYLTGGKTPRNFAIDPTGTYVLAENQASDNIVIFKINQETGGLVPTGTVVDVPSPVCVKFLSLSAK